jgi:hypothetical protein
VVVTQMVQTRTKVPRCAWDDKFGLVHVMFHGTDL